MAELYSFDAVSILGYLAARTETMELGSGILPIYSRTPALTAMTAAGLDAVSGGGSSWGWAARARRSSKAGTACRSTSPSVEPARSSRSAVRSGVVNPSSTPAPTTRFRYRPIREPDWESRSSSSITRYGEDIPVFIASIGPKNVELTAEIADGWIPVFFHPEKAVDVWGDALAAGQANRSSDLASLAVVAGGPVAICDEATAAKIRDGARGTTALYVGGMGAKGRNFYNNVFRRYGYEAEAEQIQELYLSGHKEEAMAKVPQEFLDATSMVGDEGYVKERVEAYRAAGVTHLRGGAGRPRPGRLGSRSSRAGQRERRQPGHRLGP